MGGCFRGHAVHGQKRVILPGRLWTELSRDSDLFEKLLFISR